MVLALGGFLRPAHTAWAQAPTPSGTVITIAGNGSFSFCGDAGLATEAGLNRLGLAIGLDGAPTSLTVANFHFHPLAGKRDS